jgi:OmpA-OmpF porin, OOP family
MKMKSLTIAALAAGSLLLGNAARAQPYIGISIGQSDIDESVAEGLITSGTTDGKDTGFKLFGGYRFHRHIAAELAYLNLGELRYSGTFFGTPVSGGKVEAHGFNVSAVGLLPVSEEFALFAKLGLFAWEAKASDTTGGVPFSASTDGADVSFGIGASYDFTRQFSVRAEWERFKLENADADLLSVGVLFRF